MKKQLLTLTLTLVTLFTFAQELAHDTIDWSENPTWSELSSDLKDEPEVRLKNFRFVNFTYSEKYNNSLVEYITVHRKTRVNSDDAIQSHNKVYIPMSSSKLENAKARVITPSGKIINFDSTNIQKSEGGEDRAAHTYFAIDGVEKGSDIEYIYTILKAPNYQGTKLIFQDEYTQQNVEFHLASPKNLEFDFKSYNGFPEITMDSTNEEANVYTVRSEQIDKLVNEDYAPYEKSLQNIVYKLEKNTSTGKGNLTSFDEISGSYYEGLMTDLKKDKKSIAKLLKASGALSASSDEEKVRAIENYIKSNITVQEGIPSKTIAEILKDKYTGPRGVLRLTIEALNQLNIKFEIVITCNNNEQYFDKDFEYYNVLQHSFIYLPKMKKYLAMDKFNYRLGIIPSSWTNQHGLFIKGITIGDVTTGVGKVKFIDALPAEKTIDVMDVELDFSYISEPYMSINREITGYSAVHYQCYYKLFDEDTKKEVDESMLTFSDENAEVIEYKMTGVETEDFNVNPMVYKGKIKSTTLVERAGNRYIFNIGNVIGPQMEMYQKEERKTDIAHDHNMIYKRTISFNIPDGYEVSGLDDLKINQEYPSENPFMYFYSDYEVKGNKVIVTITEGYHDMEIDKSLIDDFRRVINAAANFNKTVVFFTKK